MHEMLNISILDMSMNMEITDLELESRLPGSN